MAGLVSRVCPGGPNTAAVDSPGGLEVIVDSMSARAPQLPLIIGSSHNHP